MLKFYIVGAYGYGNVGDDACKEVITKEILKKFPDAEIVCHLPGSNLFSPEYFDAVILGGGGIIYDFKDPSGTNNLKYYLRYARTMQIFEKKSIALGIGVQGRFSEQGKKIVRETFNAMNLITVRDEESKKYINDCGIRNDIYICADLAFLLEPQNSGEHEIEKTDKPLLGVCLTPSMENSIQPFHPDFDSIVSRLIPLLKEKFDLIFFSFDYRFDNYFRQKCSPESRLISYSPDVSVEEFLYAVGQVDLMLTTRYHATIFALLMDKPFIPIVEPNEKLSRLIKHIDYPYFATYNSSCDFILFNIEKMWVERNLISQKIIKDKEDLKSNAKQNIQLLIKILKGDLIENNLANNIRL